MKRRSFIKMFGVIVLLSFAKPPKNTFSVRILDMRDVEVGIKTIKLDRPTSVQELVKINTGKKDPRSVGWSFIVRMNRKNTELTDLVIPDSLIVIVSTRLSGCGPALKGVAHEN